MRYVSATDARNNFSEIIELAKHEPVMIQKQGRNEALIVSPDRYRGPTASRTELTQKLEKLAKQMRATAKKNGLTKKIFDEIMAQRD